MHMMSLAQQAFGGIIGEIGKRLFRVPRSWWYGLSVGLVTGIPAVIWAQLVLSNQISARVFASMNPLLQFLLSWGSDIAPILLILAAGARLGSRNGHLRDGLVMGAVAGGAYAMASGLFLLVHIVAYALSVTTPMAMFRPTETLIVGMVCVLVLVVGFDLLLTAICAGLGAGLGALGAFVALRRHHLEKQSWHEAAGIVIGSVSGDATMAPEPELPPPAE